MRKSIIRRSTQMPDIPTASTADIAFLLILFFMVTTVFRPTTLNLNYKLPTAKSTERIRMRRHVAHVYVDNKNMVYIDDNLVSEELVAAKIAPKVWEDPELITIINVDENVNYGKVDVILDQLKEAKAFKITFGTERPKE
ncbi:MAG: biopolymer transporter ExbD [candidate division WOR-3 bacterium]|nr:MAG: biopolymer transporter ExbD [candidate division WOR-3 bacterium]